MRTAWIKVDLNRLTLRLWRSQGIWLSGFELRQWLTSRGYTWGGGTWYLCQEMPCDLESDEVITSQVMVTEAGVTFVERSSRADSSSQSVPPPDPGPPLQH
ncbi:MAG TPA: hypothetical protein VIM11_06210 [Tepidisphaeraceae bacterium]